jgi:hypothetical protein
LLTTVFCDPGVRVQKRLGLVVNGHAWAPET